MTLRYWSSPQPTELIRQLGAGICNTTALHWYRRGHRFKSFLWASIFSGLIFTTTLVVIITTRIASIFMISRILQQ